MHNVHTKMHTVTITAFKQQQNVHSRLYFPLKFYTHKYVEKLQTDFDDILKFLYSRNNEVVNKDFQIKRRNKNYHKITNMQWTLLPEIW